MPGFRAFLARHHSGGGRECHRKSLCGEMAGRQEAVAAGWRRKAGGKMQKMAGAAPGAAVIFDLDGTLIDSVPDIHAAANRVFGRRGISFTRPEVQGFVGRGAPNLVARLAEARGLPFEGAEFDALLAEFLEEYERAQALTTLYPDVRAALEGLAQAGYRLGLCTNKPLAPTRAVLRHFGLEALFAVVIGGDSLPVKKPDPAPLRATLAEMGGGAAVFVGDSEVDAETAQAAGMAFLLYTEGYRKSAVEALPHTAAFCDFKDLAGLVAQTVSASAAP